MKEFTVSVRKLTDEDLMREACEATFLGTSHASLKSMYKAEHSPARTQLFWIVLKGVPLAVAGHCVRHHVGVQHFQLSCRDDRNKQRVPLPDLIDGICANMNEHPDWEDIRERDYQRLQYIKKNYDRATPVNLSMLVNAQSLIDQAKLRLCSQAHASTRKVFQAIIDELTKVDPDLAALCQPKCIYRGGICGEPKCCGYNNTAHFRLQLRNYVAHFNEQQRGIHNSLFATPQ